MKTFAVNTKHGSLQVTVDADFVATEVRASDGAIARRVGKSEFGSSWEFGLRKFSLPHQNTFSELARIMHCARLAA